MKGLVLFLMRVLIDVHAGLAHWHADRSTAMEARRRRWRMVDSGTFWLVALLAAFTAFAAWSWLA